MDAYTKLAQSIIDNGKKSSEELTAQIQTYQAKILTPELTTPLNLDSPLEGATDNGNTDERKGEPTAG